MTDRTSERTDLRDPSGEWLTAMWLDEYRKHQDCDPPCIDASTARQRLVASGVDPDKLP